MKANLHPNLLCVCLILNPFLNLKLILYSQVLFYLFFFLLGSLSLAQRTPHWERHQTKDLISSTRLRTCINLCLYVSLPSSISKNNMIKFCVFWRASAMMAKFWKFLLKLVTGVTSLVWVRFLNRSAHKLRNSKIKCESKLLSNTHAQHWTNRFQTSKIRVDFC